LYAGDVIALVSRLRGGRKIEGKVWVWVVTTFFFDTWAMIILDYYTSTPSDF
jgi:hypothetical protein